MHVRPIGWLEVESEKDKASQIALGANYLSPLETLFPLHVTTKNRLEQVSDQTRFRLRLRELESLILGDLVCFFGQFAEELLSEEEDY